MTRRSYDDDRLVPLISDAQIETRVDDLIGRANLRQLWLLFLDEADVQLPLLIPIDGLPSVPEDAHATAVLSNVAELMDGIGAARIVLVLERYGPPVLSSADVAWARSLASGCQVAGLNLRAMLLSHRRGVRWIAPDDYV